MNNTESNRTMTTLKTPSQDAQGRWYELLSPIQVLVEQVNSDNNTKQQQQLHQYREKKKCRGNRKEQHKRRRIRRRLQKQQMNTNTNSMDQDIMIHDIDNDDSELEQIQTYSRNNHPEIRLENKRKRQELNKDNVNVSRSFSQLSISQQNNPKKKRSTTVKPTATNNQSNDELLNVVNDHNEQENNRNDMQIFKPQYLQVSDKIFLQMLSNTFQDGDKQIIQCLNTNEKLQFIRQITEITNNLQYFDLQCHLWQDYYNCGMKEGLWAPRLSKSYARQHHTCRTYGFPKHVIEKRQQTIQHQLDRTKNELQQHLIKLQQYAQQWQPSFDPNLISHAIHECVKKGQQRLRQEFEYRRKMLELDSNDRHLITKFYQIQPNEEQIHLAKTIWQKTADELKMKEYEEILRKRIYLQRLPSGIDKIIDQSIDPIQLLLSDPILNKDRRASLISSCSKTITQYKFDLMTINLNTIQNIKHGHQELLMDLQKKLSQSDWNESIKKAIVNRQEAMIERHDISDGGIKRMREQRHRRSSIFIYKTITASSPFIEVDLNLTSQQMSMFINGLKYIVPCQSRLCSRKSINEIITEQYQNISTSVKNCLQDNDIFIGDPRVKQTFSALERILNQLYLKPLPKYLLRRAQHEYKIVQSIQHLLRQRPDIVIRRTDKSKVFYIGKSDDFERKAQEYMLKTQAYEEITNGRCPLVDNLRAVQTLLDYFMNKNVLTKRQHKQLSPNLNKLELGHYHGLPKPHKPETPLRPIIASINAPTTLISKFLNDLLAPIFLHVAHKTTFINGIDVVRKLEKYIMDGYFKSTTKFITADVTDLYTMIPRQGALEALARFCLKHSKQHGTIGTLTIDHIMRMARLILDTNTFAYNNKYYQQIRGGAMGSAFTQVLANIYMLEWEQDLIQYQAKHNEIYGRYIDDIFMTTNQTIDEIKKELEQAANKDVNIKINYQIDISVDFLDVSIRNEHSQLKTTIYHKSAAEPYILPYKSDHPRHIHRNIPYGALLNAVRICSNIHDFNSELCRIDMSLLLNGYPPNFIRKQFYRLLHSKNDWSVLELMNEHVYHRMHQILLHQPTRREKQLNKTIKDPIELPLVLQPQLWNSKVMYPRYLFDSGLSTNLPHEFIKWWKEYYSYPGSSVYDVKVRLVAKTHCTLESFFIHKKPSREMLTKME